VQNHPIYGTALDLVAAFLRALSVGDLDEAESVVEQLEALASA
jgi:hypothetical protein